MTARGVSNPGPATGLAGFVLGAAVLDLGRPPCSALLGRSGRFTSTIDSPVAPLYIGAEFLRVLFVSGPWVCLRCPLRPGAGADVRPPLLPEVMISVVQERET